MKFSSRPVLGTSSFMWSLPSTARYCLISLSTAEVSKNTSSGLGARGRDSKSGSDAGHNTAVTTPTHHIRQDQQEITDMYV